MVVDNHTVYKIEGKIYTNEGNLLKFSFGPSSHKDGLEKMVESFEEDTSIIVLEKRTDEITRGETTRSEEPYREENSE